MSNVRKIDFGAGRTWAAHAQDHWLDFAGNPNFPDYMRIVFVAYGRHHANGHAKLEREELARYLVRRDGSLPGRGIVRPSIQKAIQLGYLAPGSQALCLIVSSDHIQGGLGDPNRRCPRDHTKRTSTKSPDRDDNGRITCLKHRVSGCSECRKDGHQNRPSTGKDGDQSCPSIA